MADLDVSPVVQNGGGGAAQVGGVRAPDYRQVQAPMQVDTNLPNNEGARRAQALREAFSDFGGLGASVYKNVTSQAGALAGAASGATGHPAYKEGLARLTAYGQAFNNAATGAYAVEAEAQADDAAARLRVQANNDPATFAKTFSAVRDGVLKNAPPLAQPILTELYNRKLAEGLAAISGDQAAEQKKLQGQTYEIGVDRQTSRVAQLQGSANPIDQAKAADEQVKLNLLIQGGVKAGLYSPAEAQAMHVNAMRAITQQVFETQLDRELANPAGDPIGLIERFRDMHMRNAANTNEPQVLSEPEFQQLMATAKQKIIQERQMTYFGKQQGDVEQELRYANGDRLYTAKLFDHTLTSQQLSQAVTNGDLKPEVARSLGSYLANTGGRPAKSAAGALDSLYRDPTFLDMSRDEILSHPGLSLADQNKALDEQRKQLAGWEGTPNVKNAKAYIIDQVKPHGIPWEMMDEDQKHAATNSWQEFLQQMQATDPAKRDSSAATIAQGVVKKFQQQQALEAAGAAVSAKQSFIQRYGPGGPKAGGMSPDDYKARLQQYDDQIKQYRAAAGAQ